MKTKFIITTTILTLGSIFSIWFLWERGILLTIILLMLAGMELWVVGSKKMLVAYPIIIFGGVLTEMVAIYFGAWHYTSPTFINVPLWLLPAWGNAGLISICVYKLVGEILFKK